jgi:hypothetical protein
MFYRFFDEEFHHILFTHLGFFDIFGNTRPWDWLYFNWDVTYGKNIARFLDTPKVGRQLDVVLSARIKVIPGLTVEPNYAYEHINADDGSGTLESGAIYRAKLTYQFSRSLSARLIVQYDEFAKVLEVDPLLSLQLGPFTSVYLGSSHDYTSTDPNIIRLQPSERHFFAKLQYLIQG